MRETDIIIAALAVIAIASGFLAIEARRIMYAILGLAIMLVCLGFIFWMVIAPYVGLFHLLVYAGAVIILLATAVFFVGGERIEVAQA